MSFQSTRVSRATVMPLDDLDTTNCRPLSSNLGNRVVCTVRFLSFHFPLIFLPHKLFSLSPLVTLMSHDVNVRDGFLSVAVVPSLIDKYGLPLFFEWPYDLTHNEHTHLFESVCFGK